MTATTATAIMARLAGHDIDATLHGDPDTVCDDVFHAHSDVRPGGLFCCVVGAHADGHDHAAAAVAAGAVGLLCERRLDLGVPEIVVDDVRAAMGPVAALVHGDPSTRLCCTGITGTNGKTTTASLLASILRAAGRSPVVFGTLSGVRTTPEATDLQRDLARAVTEGHTDVVMEVSSHALALHRVDGTSYDLAVFTNLSRDHLDFHGTMEEYFRAKARLFEPGLSAKGVVDTDDAYGRLIRDAADIPVDGFGLADAEPVLGLAPVAFTWQGEPVHLALAGRFNIANALAAASSARALGIDDAAVRAGLESADAVPGRFEMIRMGQNFTVIVDFAHTPDALVKAIAAAREIAAAGRVLVVFGAGGDRDPTKRPFMGAAAERADVIVLTNDNPRTEPPAQIADEIRGGMQEGTRATIELDRRAAIATVLEEATAGDVVLIAGKGHETTQTIGSTVRPFDDREVARAELTRLGFGR